MAAKRAYAVGGAILLAVMVAAVVVFRSVEIDHAGFNDARGDTADGVRLRKERRYASLARPAGQSTMEGAKSGDVRPGGDPRSPAGLSNEQILEDFVREIQLDTRPLLGGVSVREMRDEFLAESRDEAWAKATEDNVRAFVNMLGEQPGNAPDVPWVQCRETLCEVRAVVTSSDKEVLSKWQDDLTGMRDSKEWRFEFTDTRTLTGRATDGRIVNVTYLVR